MIINESMHFMDTAIYWGSYEGIKKMCGHEKDPSLSFSFMAGAVAGSVCMH